MSNQNSRHGKREAGGQASLLARYKNWLAGLDRGQRIRYRALQAATIAAIIIILGYLILTAWIRVPSLPGLNQNGLDGTGDISFEGAELPEVAKSGQREGVYTFLVAGRDVASGATDTMLLITFDTQNKTINAISLLRDTMINTSTSSKRLNAVYARNRGSSDLSEEERVERGMTALKQEVSKLTGIYPNFYVLLEWEAVGELVDAVGGVYFEVPFDMDYEDPYQDLYIHQKAGYRLLTGSDAMQVIRFRKTNDGSISLGDVGRTAIQRDFLTAVLDKCLQPATLLKVPSLAKIFLDNVKTDLSIGNILAFAQLAIGMDTENDVNFVSMPYTDAWYKGAAMVVAQEDELLELLNNGINPYLVDIQSSDLQLMYKKSDGSYDVTNAVLADERMKTASASTAPSTSPEDEESEVPIESEPVEPDEPVNPEAPNGGQTGNGDVTQGGDTSQGSGEHSGEPETPPDESQQPESGKDGQTGEGGSSQGDTSIGTIDPDQVLPDPNASVSRDTDSGGEESGSPLAVLPSRPEPVEQAA